MFEWNRQGHHSTAVHTTSFIPCAAVRWRDYAIKATLFLM
jgi:hypothetical protein